MRMRHFWFQISAQTPVPLDPKIQIERTWPALDAVAATAAPAAARYRHTGRAHVAARLCAAPHRRTTVRFVQHRGCPWRGPGYPCLDGGWAAPSVPLRGFEPRFLA